MAGVKPQIIIPDFAGAHNKDIQKTSARLIKGASWKKQRIVVILPASDTISSKVALSHWCLVFPPNNAVLRTLALGQEVGEAYSNTIEALLANPELTNWEYILTLEHDNCPPADGVIKLAEQMDAHPELDVISGLYFTKGEGGVAQIWGDINDPVINFRPQPPDPNGGLKECYGVGMGFALWRLKMFKDSKLRKPWFKTEVTAHGASTQDLYAWGDFKKHGYRCAVDCSVKVGHYDAATDTMW